VGLAPGGGDVAAFGAALAVADRHDEALVLVEEAAGVAQVQGLGLAAQDEGDEVGVAGQSHRLGRGDQVAGVQGGGADPVLEPVEVDGDHDGGGRAAVLGQHLGGQGFEQGPEGVTHPDLVRDALPGVGVDRGDRVGQVGAPR
jgi:hypothetical protein